MTKSIDFLSTESRVAAAQIKIFSRFVPILEADKTFSIMQAAQKFTPGEAAKMQIPLREQWPSPISRRSQTSAIQTESYTLMKIDLRHGQARANEFLADLNGVHRVYRISIGKALVVPIAHRYDFLTAYVDDLHNASAASAPMTPQLQEAK